MQNQTEGPPFPTLSDNRKIIEYMSTQVMNSVRIGSVRAWAQGVFPAQQRLDQSIIEKKTFLLQWKPFSHSNERKVSIAS